MGRSGSISEAEWIALVTRIEEAMCIIPFVPHQEDVITLLSMAVNSNQHMLRVEDLEHQVERLRDALALIVHHQQPSSSEMRRIARDALGGGEDG